MKRILLAGVVVFCLVTPANVAAQRGKGAGGGGAGAPQMQGQGNSGNYGQGMGQGSMNRTQDQTKSMERDRIRAQATSQQRNEYRTCDQSMKQAITQARTMSRTGRGSSGNVEQLRSQHQQLTEQLRTLERNRERLYQGLGQDQQNAIQEQNRKMTQAQDRIQEQLRQMDREMAGTNLNAKSLANQAQNAEREMKTYEKQLHEAGKTLDLLND